MALGCARNGGGSPWTRSTGDSAVSGGTQGIMQNSSEKSVLLHQVRRDEQWKRICSRETEERSFRKSVSLIDNFPGKTGNHTQDKTEPESCFRPRAQSRTQLNTTHRQGSDMEMWVCVSSQNQMLYPLEEQGGSSVM